MTKHLWKSGIAAASALLLAACGEESATEADSTAVDTSSTAMAEVIADQGALTQLAKALETTGLNGALEGEASYTLLAPSDEAFASLGDLSKSDGALIANVLRGHMLPGAITTDAIKEAAGEGGGQVAMQSFGSGTLTFTVNGETILVANEGGAQAKLSGTPIVTSNGVILPIDAVLADPEALKAPAEAE